MIILLSSDQDGYLSNSGLGSGLDKGCLHLTTQLLFAVLPLKKTSIIKPLIIPPISLYFV